MTSGVLKDAVSRHPAGRPPGDVPPRPLLGRLLLIGTLGALLFGCGGGIHRDGAPDGHPDLSHTPDAVPRAEPYSRASLRSYRVLGRTYHPLSNARGFVERGIASWYGRKFHGNRTANGERYDMYAMTAAHRRLPLPSYVQVRNLENGRTAIVRVNDRGPFHENRIIDLSYAAASKLGMLDKGTALVEIRAIDPGAPRLAKAPSRAPAQAPRIFIQVGAFSDPGNARRLADRLSKTLRRDIRVRKADSPLGPVHRVQIGPLASVEVADRVVATLEKLQIHDTRVLLR